ncbi:MAG: flagellar biosynthesis protein FlhB [Mesorhizobium sp.]
MSENSDKESKTEEATEKKIRDSVEKGQTPFSKEIPLFGSFVAVLIFCFFFSYDTAMRLGSFLAIFLERPDEWTLGNSADAIGLYELVSIEIGRALMVVLALMMAFGLAGGIFQNPPAFVADRIAPKMSRISLIKGWERMFGAKGIVEFLKSVAKVVFATAFVVFALRDTPAQLLAGMLTNPTAFGPVMLSILVQMLITITLVMLLIAAADLLWTRFNWRTDLRMTRQEVKDEMKQTDGDPLVKSRIRSLQRDRARSRMMANVPTATLIIANPTHFSIALRYERDRDSAPVVVAKGQDLVALKIREIAAEHGIPVFEDVALARSMYKQVSVDSVIPSQFYQAVAELIRVIYANAAKKSPGPRTA